MLPDLDTHAARLLGRPLVDLAVAPLGRARVLVTGAAGSIGAALVARLLEQGVHVTALDRDETNLFRLLDAHPDAASRGRLTPELADVTDPPGVEAAFARARPELVLHAAAYKHVPLLEAFPRAALTNNLVGTQVVADACAARRLRMVFVSTDKAVAPVSVMGASKLACELALRAREDVDVAIVRFGNVLGSRGSVLEVLSRQLARGRPMTLTHPDMRRFFLAPREAVDFVLCAASLAAGTYVLDTGAPIAIVDLARRLAGAPDPEVVFVGARAGERLDERLHDDTERLGETSTPHIFRVMPAAPSSRDALGELLDLTVGGASDDDLRAALAALAPSLGSLS